MQNITAELQEQIASLPNATGVYYFMSRDKVPLYIGKSLDIRARIKSHWQDAKTNPRKMRLWQQTASISYEFTAGGYTALFLEAQEIKKYTPLYNRQLRQQRNFCSIKLSEGKRPIQFVRHVELNRLTEHYGLFKSQLEAKHFLERLCETTNACKYFCGLSNTRPCFQAQLKRCQNNCDKTISAKQQQINLINALSTIRLKQWPYPGIVAIKEHCPSQLLTQYILIYQWCFLGIVESLDKITDYKSTTKSLDRDYYRLTTQLLLQQTKLELTTIPINEVNDS